MEQMAPDYPIAEALAEQGWWMQKAFFSKPLTRHLYQEVLALWESGDFRQAKIGPAGSALRRSKIRGDLIRWWDPEALSAAQESYGQQMEHLKFLLNRELFLNLAHWEAHYAVYPPGSRYARHVDRFQDSPERMISSVCYLNPDWDEQEGGQLRLFTEEGVVEVLPECGTMVLFRSDIMEHEVVAATRNRFSIAGWFRRRPEAPVRVIHA
jgi:SM-20-related protein